MTVKVSQLILETEIQNKYKLKKTLISETKQLSNQVRTVCSDIIYRGLLYKLRKTIDGKIRTWRMTHERKLQHLRAQLPVRNKQVLRKFVPNIIHNFSSYTLTKREKEVLSYSLDQCVPSKIDQQGLKVEFEHFYQNILPHLSHLSHEELTSLKTKTRVIYEQYSKIKVPVEDQEIIKGLRNNESIAILKQDKGRGVVIMDKSLYVERTHENCCNIIVPDFLEAIVTLQIKSRSILPLTGLKLKEAN